MGIVYLFHRVSDAGGIHIWKGIDLTVQKAQYDAACKRVLAEKIILAWIMKRTMKEYANYEVKEIVQMIINQKEIE